MRVLNAFHQYVTEKEGKEPKPMEVESCDDHHRDYVEEYLW